METTTTPTTGVASDDLAAMRSQKASWQTDGLGLRGKVEMIRNTKARLDWENTSVVRRTSVDLES